MSYTVALSDNGRYIVCRVTVPITMEVARAFTLEMDRLSRATRVKRFLSDVREAPNVLDTIGNYDFAYSEMPGFNLQKDARAAILASPADRSHDFVETVSQNAGYRVRLFRDEAAAIAWLNE